MPRLTARRKTAALAFAVVLLLPWSAAAETQRTGASSPQLGTPHLLARIWSAVVALWDQTGCSLDPSGDGENGCSLDPDGQSAGAVEPPSPDWSSGDTGCSIDPSGCPK